jgi:hypothetical protein
LLIGLVIAGHRVAWLSVRAPFSWAVDADWNPMWMTVVVAGLFAILIPRLPPRRGRAGARVAMGVLVVYYGLLPGAMVLGTRPALGRVRTVVDKNEVCRQTTAYTCGPAAAVTCLRRLGIRAEERELALAAGCTPSFGTDAWVLARAIHGLYPNVTCRYDYFSTLEAVPLPAIAVCELPRVGGHYVALLEVNGEGVVVGDPMSGRQRVSREEFMREWKGTAVTLRRE